MIDRQSDAVIVALRSAAVPLAAVAIVNSMLLMGVHCRENRHRPLRVYTLRILLMVVIDSVAAVIALWGVGWLHEADELIVKLVHYVVELYESVVIFSFLQFVLVCGGGPQKLASRFADVDPKAGFFPCCRRAAESDDESPSEPRPTAAAPVAAPDAAGAIDVAAGVVTTPTALAASPATVVTPPEATTRRKRKKRKLQHLPMMSRILPPWRSGHQMLRWCVLGTLSYVVWGGTLAVVGTVLLLLGPGHNNNLIWGACSLVLSATQAIAIFSLAELAINVREEIADLKPYGKFLSVKFVVFFAFWQKMVLQGLQRLGAFQEFENARRCSESCAVEVIQNTLICIEMLAASIIHFYVFPPHDYLRLLARHLYQHGEIKVESLGEPESFAEVVDIRDIFQTAWQVHQPSIKAQTSNGSLNSETSQEGARALQQGGAEQGASVDKGGVVSDASPTSWWLRAARTLGLAASTTPVKKDHPDVNAVEEPSQGENSSAVTV